MRLSPGRTNLRAEGSSKNLGKGHRRQEIELGGPGGELGQEDPLPTGRTGGGWA